MLCFAVVILSSVSNHGAYEQNKMEPELLVFYAHGLKWVQQSRYFYWTPVLFSSLSNTCFRALVLKLEGSKSPGGLVTNNNRLLSSTPWVCDLRGLEWGSRITFQRSSQVILFLLVQRPHFRNQKKERNYFRSYFRMLKNKQNSFTLENVVTLVLMNTGWCMKLLNHCIIHLELILYLELILLFN